MVGSNVHIVENKNPHNDYRKNVDLWLEWIKLKVEAVVWAAIFLFVFHQTEIVKEIFTSPKINRLFFHVYLITFSINFGCCLFVLFVTKILGFKNYEDYSTKITPVAAVSVFVNFLSLIITVFPIYRFLTLIIVPVLSFSFMMFSHLIPFKGELNTFCLFLLLVGLVGYGYHFYR